MGPIQPDGLASTPDDAALSDQEFVALQQACGPVSLLSFPPPEIIRTLRQRGYVEIVLGGLQITTRGLERLLRESKRRRVIRTGHREASTS